jgi:hypothetical protein
MERYCSTGQSPQRAVVPTDEEEDLFDRPKPTAGCSANGRRRRYFLTVAISKLAVIDEVSDLS